MLFAKKSNAATGKKPEAHDIVDVEDVSVTPTAPVEPQLRADTAQETTEAPAARGVFLDSKPSASTAAPKGLRERFLRKGSAAPAAVVDAQPVKPAADAKRRLWTPKAKPAEVEAPQAAPAPVAPKEKAGFKWPLRKKTEAASVAEPVSTSEQTGPIGPTEKVRKPIVVRKVSDKKRKFQELPIRVFMGYLPEVTERDARDYALGIAERNCEQISLVYYDAFKLNDGYAYEVHEGGSGRAFLPEIIEHFAAQGPFAKGGVDANVFIRTATRMVQVERTHDGLQAFQLPESAVEVASDWLEGTTKMTPAIQTMTSVLVVGAALFTTGFLAMTLAMVSRIQPYDPPPAPIVERATDGFNLSPLSRWTTLQGVTGDEYVKALRYANGKWELDRGTAPAAAPVADPAAPVAPTAATN